MDMLRKPNKRSNLRKQTNLHIINITSQNIKTNSTSKRASKQQQMAKPPNTPNDPTKAKPSQELLKNPRKNEQYIPQKALLVKPKIKKISRSSQNQNQSSYTKRPKDSAGLTKMPSSLSSNSWDRCTIRIT